ncbi:MAG: hypothetical protein LBT05_04700 [Planctomycetaceae bacterium]|jgi:uncharacterized protein|nr:hypothetical protein [Planctomycetaceae bacterium]
MSSNSYVKYKTHNNNSYIYDVRTNEIIRISHEIFDVIDDFVLFDRKRFFDKYNYWGNDRLHKLEKTLSEFVNLGMFQENTPLPIKDIAKVTVKGKETTLENFILSTNRLLLLEITQKCNLRCRYCCYSDFYPETRKHSQKTILAMRSVF